MSCCATLSSKMTTIFYISLLRDERLSNNSSMLCHLGKNIRICNISAFTKTSFPSCLHSSEKFEHFFAFQYMQMSFATANLRLRAICTTMQGHKISVHFLIPFFIMPPFRQKVRVFSSFSFIEMRI